MSEEKELQANILISVGILKLFSENSTYLIGELSKEKKQWFNATVNSADNLLKEIEKDLAPEHQETLLVLTEALNDGIFNLKKDLLQNL